MEALPSLPPGVRGLVQGVLVLEVQALEGVEADEVWVKFYGAQRAEQVKLQCKVIYAIRSPKEVFVGYLEDMKELRVEVVQKGRAIGRAAVDFGPYISTQAEPLQLQGKFPICQEDEIGDVVIAAYTDFETWEEELARTGLAPETSLGEAEKPFPTANFAGNLEIVRIPRSALRRIDRPAPKAENPSKSSSISQSQLIESLQKRGETLRKLMAAREKVPETAQEETSPGKSIPLLPLPTIKHLKLQVQSLTVLDSSLVQSRILVLDCSIPSLSLQPGLKLSQAAQNRYEGTTPLSIETFHLQHKGGSGNVYVYEHESWHSVNVGNIGGLANSAVSFRMQVEGEEVGRVEVEKLEMKLEALETGDEPDAPQKYRERFLKFMQILEEVIEKDKPFSSLLRQIKAAIEHELDQSHLSSITELEAQNKRLAQMVTEIKSRILHERQEREQREQRISSLAADNAALRDKAEELEKLLSSCPTSVMTQSSKSKSDVLGPFAEESKVKTRRIKELEEELAAYKKREEKLMQLLEVTHKEGTRRQKGRPARSGDYSFGSPTLELSDGSESEAAMTPMPSRRTERSQHAQG